MPNPRTRRAVACLSLAACALIASCGGEAGRAGGSAQTEERRPAALAALGVRPAASHIVVFQLTGLLMMVPPKHPGDSTHVLLPNVTGHSARFGFGLRVNRPELCRRYVDGICYVDLARWRLDAIGAGGVPTDPANTGIPERIVNLTHGSGGAYRVNLAEIDGTLRGRVSFLSGQAVGTPCSLARWVYTRVDADGTSQPTNKDTLALPNVVTWKMEHPIAQPLTLRFSRGDRILSVPLEAPDLGHTRVLLAHVPDWELAYLPPNTPKEASMEGVNHGRLEHFHDFYNLLRKPGQNGAPSGSHRPIPVFAGTGEAAVCKVSITGLTSQKSSNTATGGIKTFGCVIGSAEG